MFKDMTIKAKMSFLVGIMVVLTSVMVIISFSNVSALSSIVDQMHTDSVLATRYLAGAQDAMWRLRYGISQYIAVPDPDKRKQIIGESQKWYNLMDENLRLYSGTKLSDTAKSALKEMNDIFAQYREARPKWFELMESGKTEEAAVFRAKTILVSGAGCVDALNKLIDIQTKQGDEINTISGITVRNAKIKTFAAGILIVLAVLIVIAWITITLFKQLGGEPGCLASIAQSIAEGDLTIKFKTGCEMEVINMLTTTSKNSDRELHYGGNGKVDVLATNMNKMVGFLNSVINNTILSLNTVVNTMDIVKTVLVQMELDISLNELV